MPPRLRTLSVALTSVALGLLASAEPAAAATPPSSVIRIGQVRLVAGGAAAIVTTTVKCPGTQGELSLSLTQPQLASHPQGTLFSYLPCGPSPRTAPVIATVCNANTGCPPLRPGKGIVTARFDTTTGSTPAVVVRHFTPTSVNVGTARTSFPMKGHLALNGLIAHVPVVVRCASQAPLGVQAQLVQTVAGGSQVVTALGFGPTNAGRCQPGQHTYSVAFRLDAGHSWQSGPAFVMANVSVGPTTSTIYRTIHLAAGTS